jgi:hypothetical protein
MNHWCIIVWFVDGYMNCCYQLSAYQLLLSANSIVCNDRTWQDSMGNLTLLERKRTLRIHSCVLIADDFLKVWYKLSLSYANCILYSFGVVVVSDRKHGHIKWIVLISSPFYRLETVNNQCKKESTEELSLSIQIVSSELRVFIICLSMSKIASNNVSNSQTKEKLQATIAKYPANSFREGVMAATVIHTVYLETVRSQQHQRLTRITIVVLYDHQVI